ncbi:MAG: thiolase domain-containing protein [Chloroflexi bacterium]|nr:thiolase domain-containing protein [Chloroflexota bacterium]
MAEVVIVGIGQTRVGEHWDRALRDLAMEAIQAALHDAGHLRPQALFVANMLGPVLSRQSHLGTLLADFAGLGGIEAVTVEAAGASGAAALRQAYLAIRSGAVDVALVVGAEKFTDQVGPVVEAAAAITLDADYEAEHGLTPTAQAGLLTRLYLERYQVPEDALGVFPLLAHRHAVGNPYAMFRRAIKPSVYQAAVKISDPVNLFDAAPYADGAAAVIVARRDVLPPEMPQPLVRIAGSAAATDTLALHDREDPLAFDAARRSAKVACEQAGWRVGDVDFVEIFDAYSVYAALSLEALGLAPRGQAWRRAQEGVFDLDGDMPILTMGGLKARGYPGGATGVYQVVEAVLQLRGQAGDNQIVDARRALVQSLGGPASTAVTHLLERLR